MLALGLVLLVLSGAVAVGVALNNTDATSASAFGLTLSNVSIGGLFLAGAVVGMLFMLGLALMVAGAGRRRAQRQLAKREVRSARQEKDELAQENAELKAQLHEPYAGDGPVPVDGRRARSGLFHR